MSSSAINERRGERVSEASSRRCGRVGCVSDQGLGRLPLPPTMPLLWPAAPLLLLPLPPPLLLLLPVVVVTPVVLAVLLMGLAAADVTARAAVGAGVAAVAALVAMSEWPVVFANTFLFRSSSAFRSASWPGKQERHNLTQPRQRLGTWVLDQCGGAQCSAVQCCVLCCVALWWHLPLPVLDGVVEEERSQRGGSVDVWRVLESEPLGHVGCEVIAVVVDDIVVARRVLRLQLSNQRTALRRTVTGREAELERLFVPPHARVGRLPGPLLRHPAARRLRPACVAPLHAAVAQLYARVVNAEAGEGRATAGHGGLVHVKQHALAPRL